MKGRFQRIHRWTGLALQAFLFGTPWIMVAGHPAVQFDIGAGRAFLLGNVFTPRDTIFLVLLGLFAAFSLFFFTALYGRLWCGYACPQTVFLEEWVRPIETFIEGERGVRRARDQRGWTFDRIWRKAAKWSAFAVLASVVAMTFVSWFAGARPLWSGSASVAAYGFTAFFAVTMFLDFAWFREQFCNYLCPYARFQGALADDGSLVVAYQAELGEPRQSRSTRVSKAKAAAAPPVAVAPVAPVVAVAAVAPAEVEGEGRCISCDKCVAVCPQGIDIRQGFQLECITCARCVDACEGVMQKSGYAESLIVYKPLVKQPAVRPRTIAYGTLLTGLAVAMGVLLAGRGELDATVARAPGTLYTVDTDGWIRNTFLLRVSNDSLEPIDISVTALLPGAELLVPPMHVAAAASGMAPVVVRIPPGGSEDRTLPLVLVVSAGDTHVDVRTTFKSGG
ncbi:MAG: cytochrome c oxidase accessory protein CcoG [Pseudomonadota bacterium]|nr:cytochrome c oxidase accessory protein CcoG [Pseudomonadota bacterium]